MWKEAFVDYFNVLPWHLSGGSEENHEKTSYVIVILWVKIWTWNLQAEVMTSQLHHTFWTVKCMWLIFLRVVNLCCRSNGCALLQGTCTCAPGYMGELCERKCESGWFGQECSLVCNCHDDNSIGCDPVTGACLCKPEWGGVQCETRCPPGRYGKDCSSVCECQNNSSCDPVTGHCACARGWEGEDCSMPCKQGYYGLGCKEKCPDMIYGKKTKVTTALLQLLYDQDISYMCLHTSTM
jgi:hypothetical protein